MVLVAWIVGVGGPGKLKRAVMSTGGRLKRLVGVFEQP
jgi:hypothetical protein